MEVLLRKNVEKLGKRGDIVNVAPGYARNYLIPKEIATSVSEENIKQLEYERKRMLKEEMIHKEELQKLKDKIEMTSCTIEAKATEEGHLFGSVTPQMISESYKKDGIEVDPKDIFLEDPIKELGIYSIKIKLDPEIEVSSKVWVVEKVEKIGDPNV